MSAALACPFQSCTLCFLKKMVQYMDRDGKLITESLIDYTNKNVFNHYATPDDFLPAWGAAEQKEVIIKEMEEHDILFSELCVQINQDLDLFDLICHIMFDQPPLTRSYLRFLQSIMRENGPPIRCDRWGCAAFILLSAIQTVIPAMYLTSISCPIAVRSARIYFVVRTVPIF